MSIYKGGEMVSGRGGKVGPPGVNSSGGSDMGSKIIPIYISGWINDGTEFVRTIPQAEHGMAASSALLAFTKIYNTQFDKLTDTYDSPEIKTDGTVIIRSSYKWQGVCIIAGGISQALDAVARAAIDAETTRAEQGESDLQAAITAEQERAEQAEADALTDAKDYTDERIADTVAASQTWLSAVNTAANLPTVTDTSKTYLCRVTSTNKVYQCVAGQSAWALYSTNTDYVDEDELAAAIAAETARAEGAEAAETERAKAAEAKLPRYISGGTASAYTVTAPALGDTYADGMSFEFVPHVNSAGVPTLNVNGIGAAQIYTRSNDGTSKRAFNGFVANSSYLLGYSVADSAWIVLSASYPSYAEVLNTPPLYTGTGQATDGAMTQKAITEAIDAASAGAANPYVATATWSGTTDGYVFNLPASIHGKGITPLVVTTQSGKVIDCEPNIDSAGNITIYSNANLTIQMEVR